MTSLRRRFIVIIAITIVIQGRPYPLRQWCITPCFGFSSYFRQISQFLRLREIFSNILPFPDKVFDFRPPKSLMTFLVIDHKFWISLLPPYFAKIITSPLLLQIFPSDFGKFTCFLHTLCVFRFIHSFIHSEDLYSASSRDYYSEALPAQPRTKKKDLREM